MDARRARTTRGTGRRGRGFTLLETMLTLSIVAIGVAGVFDAYTSFVITNTWSTHSATGTFLASEIRELTRNMPKHDAVTGLELDGGTLIGWGPEGGELDARDFDDLDDFDGMFFAFDGARPTPGALVPAGTRLPGPVDAAGFVLNDFSLIGLDTDGQETPFGWSQEVTVEKVDPFDFSTVVADDARQAPYGQFPGRSVDEYPVRVTVTVWYKDPTRVNPQQIAEVSWIVP